MLRLGNGDLLAVAEGRMASCGDHTGIIRVVGKISQDRGESWVEVFTSARNLLPDPIVQSSNHRYSQRDESDYGGVSRILFSIPNSQSALENMTVRLSYDEGSTWAVAKCIDSGPSAYGDLGVLDDMRIGPLFERGTSGGIVFARFSLDWLSDGRDLLGVQTWRRAAQLDARTVHGLA